MESKTALVTGASRGIGAAIAAELAGQGFLSMAPQHRSLERQQYLNSYRLRDMAWYCRCKMKNL